MAVVCGKSTQAKGSRPWTRATFKPSAPSGMRIVASRFRRRISGPETFSVGDDGLRSFQYAARSVPDPWACDVLALAWTRIRERAPARQPEPGKGSRGRNGELQPRTVGLPGEGVVVKTYDQLLE